MRAHHEESAQISAALASISRTQLSTVSTRPIASTSLLDLSGLVELRAAHETLQARNGVRNSNRVTTVTAVSPSVKESSEVDNESNFKHARQQIIKRFYQLLRDADVEGERVGTGLHRSHVWAGPSGNSLNAEKAAESRANKVRGLRHPVVASGILIV